MFLWLRERECSRGRPWRSHYAWSMLMSAPTARALGIDEISALDFGVAGRNGLLAMESSAEALEAAMGVRCSTFGFDTGAGLPPPTDARDAPFSLEPGYFAMDETQLRSRLRKSKLLLDDVAISAPAFLGEAHPPGRC
jgi:hypothetical protein